MQRDATLFHWELVKVLRLLCVCTTNTDIHTGPTDIAMQTDTLTRHEQNRAQLENDSKAEGRGVEDGEGRRERGRRRGQIAFACI